MPFTDGLWRIECRLDRAANNEHLSSMQQLPGRLVSVAILLGFAGIALAIPNLFSPAPIMLWAAYACGGVSGLLFIFELAVWCSLNLGWKLVLMAMTVAVLLPAALITALNHAREPEKSPSGEAAQSDPTIVSQNIDAATAATLTETLMETRPGYTSETLMQVGGSSRQNAVKFDDILFQDRTGDGASATLKATSDNSLVFTVTGKNGKSQDLDLPVGSTGVPTGQNLSLAVEAGNSRTGGYMRGLVNGKMVAARVVTDPIDFGDGDWKTAASSGATRLSGTKIATTPHFVTPWALSDSKLTELVANTRAVHPDFFDGDEGLLYPPLVAGRVGPSPLAGTFAQDTFPPE